ncbi:uncharacterized protein PHACADRAFT_92643, partial [Phanerochaete carnosa HHB-10118-sp]
ILLETQVDLETGALNLKKGEAILNTYSPVLTYLMRCNAVTSLLSGIAIKSVVISDCATYITDYITKSPLKMHTMLEAVKRIFAKESEMLAEEDSGAVKVRKILTGCKLPDFTK